MSERYVCPLCGTVTGDGVRAAYTRRRVVGGGYECQCGRQPHALTADDVDWTTCIQPPSDSNDTGAKGS